MSRIAKATLFPALLLSAFVFPAKAGVAFDMSMKDLDGKSPAASTVIRLEKDKARIDMARNPETYMIYRGDKGLFWTVNEKKKAYVEMTGKDIEAMRAKLDEAKKKMEAQMKNMPPEQKKMMEDMLAKMSPGASQASRTTYRKIGDGGKVGGWPTVKYEGDRDGAKVSEVWTTAPEKLGIKEGDVQVLKDMAKFFGKFSQGLSDMIANKENGLDGVPVKSIVYMEGKARFESELKSVKKEEIPASLFQVPSGYALQKSGMAE